MGLLTNLTLMVTVAQRNGQNPPVPQPESTNPPVGDVMPIDGDIYILLFVAVAIIAYTVCKRSKSSVSA